MTPDHSNRSLQSCVVLPSVSTFGTATKRSLLAGSYISPRIGLARERLSSSFLGMQSWTALLSTCTFTLLQMPRKQFQRPLCSTRAMLLVLVLVVLLLLLVTVW